MASSCFGSARMLSKSETSSCTRWSVPFALLFSSASAVALSGLRQAATTTLVGTATSCLTSSRPMPRFALRAGEVSGWLVYEEEREDAPGNEPGNRGHNVYSIDLEVGEWGDMGMSACSKRIL